jgi:glutathionylspermidine synthase
MKRHTITPRENWQEQAEELGFCYHTAGKPGEPGVGTYWDESVAYEFTSQEIDEIEQASEEIHQLCLKAVDRIYKDRDLMTRMGIPEKFHDYIQWSWARQDPSLYGRFDFAYDGKSPPRMLEYNADTPTMVIETALVQWFWLKECRQGADQFNSLHEKLLERFGQIHQEMHPGSKFYFVGYEENLEERQTLLYMQDLATQAGMQTDFVDLYQVGWLNNQFVDMNDNAMKYWFKLYPWEWMMTDDFGPNCTKDSSGIVEPVWKSLLSNKAILPVLWEMFPNHPNLLPSTWSAQEQPTTSFVSKPMFGREGANISMYELGKLVSETSGQYYSRQIYQQKADLFCDNGNYAVIGSWMVNDKAAGMIIRDHDKPIVQDLSRVVPHWFV